MVWSRQEIRRKTVTVLTTTYMNGSIDLPYNDVKFGKIMLCTKLDWLDIFPEPIKFRVTSRIRI